MAEPDDQRKRHFVLEGTAETERFRSPQQGGGGSAVPDRDRNQHGGALLRQIEALRPQVTAAREVQEAAGLEEGFGLPLLEAMAMHVPVIASNRPAIPEVAGEAALYFDPLNAQSLERAFLALENDDGLRAVLVRKGWERLRRFSWEETARRTLAVYREALS